MRRSSHLSLRHREPARTRAPSAIHWAAVRAAMRALLMSSFCSMPATSVSRFSASIFRVRARARWYEEEAISRLDSSKNSSPLRGLAIESR
ncbi:hypothetical protein [Streptomyces sp. XD-27]|uniref:hypothetical protein n=1 Tax=Streptomyces sp. XD-27 TaxID=3062779 RepID=UPI0026F4259A|nr:hypothetical protein [Streptomyces sp. XD-27]WKX73983.1 hypothetical protein Q3Y56_32615 [Streptomyces sp. XD-27]